MNTSGPIVQNVMTTIPSNGANTSSGVEAAPEGGPEAAPPAEASGVASTPAAEEPDRHLELARKFETVAKREARARKLEADYQAKLQAAEEREKAAAAREAEYRDALGDPIEHYIRNGGDPVEVAKRFGKPITEEEKRIQRLEEAYEKQTKAAEEERVKREEQQQAAQRDQALRSFVRKITPDEAPNLTSLYQANEVPAILESLLQREVGDGTMLSVFQDKYGRNPTDQEIIECLEYEAEERATRILARHRSTSGQTTPDEASSQEVASPSPRGLSNQHAGVTNSARKRPLSKEEERRQAREELTKALEAESADRRNE